MSTAPKILAIYDATDSQAWWWNLGDKLYTSVRGFGAKSWADAMQYLHHFASLGVVQLWCHGSPGRVLIAGQPMTDHFRQVLANRVIKDSLLWLRACSVFQGHKGRRHAKFLSEYLGCNVASHTYDIGPFQSGLVALRPGQKVWWKGPTKITKSGPTKPRTVTALRMTLPAWAYGK